MRSSKPDVLLSPLFILALGLLLLNDFYLKYEYSNFLTGKLSDVAGLFLFPYFLSSFRIKYSKAIYIGTAVLFMFWKSPFSTEFIHWVQATGIGFNRVIDHTDVFALGILPPSFYYFQKQLSRERKAYRYVTIPLGIVSLFAIWATSLQRVEVDLNLPINEVYEIQMSKEDLFQSIQPRYSYSDAHERTLSDSLFYIDFDIVEESINLTTHTTITSIDSITTQVRLDSILYGYMTGGLFTGVNEQDQEQLKSISVQEFKTHFETYFIKAVVNGRGESIYYDNKRYDFQNE
jgi:hypothetical protein